MKRPNLKILAVLLCLYPAYAGAGMIAAGDEFPSWSLPDHTGKQVSSADLAGAKYVLWFYPKAMTPGCTIEGNAFRESFPSFDAGKVRIFGVSFDAPKENAEFVRNESFPFQLLSDEKRVLGLAVGAATSAEQGYAQRISYLVGADGKVLEAYENVDPASHPGQILKDLATRWQSVEKQVR